MRKYRKMKDEENVLGQKVFIPWWRAWKTGPEIHN